MAEPSAIIAPVIDYRIPDFTVHWFIGYLLPICSVQDQGAAQARRGMRRPGPVRPARLGSARRAERRARPAHQHCPLPVHRVQLEASLEHASGGGAPDRGMDGESSAACGCRGGPAAVHPAHHRPRTKPVADHDQAAKLVRPVGRSSLAAWSWPATPAGGSMVSGMDRQSRRLCGATGRCWRA
jgi:hypothetical protein